MEGRKNKLFIPFNFFPFSLPLFFPFSLTFSPFEFLFAFRLIKSRRHPFLSIISLISVLGLTFGTTALLVIVSVTSGFEEKFREKILGIYPHMVIIKRGQDLSNYNDVISTLKKSSAVIAASPSTYDEMMIASKKEKAGSVIKGVELSTINNVSDVSQTIVLGNINNLKRKEDEKPGIILGIKIFEKLKVSIGDTVTLISPLRGIENRTLGPFGMEPTSSEFVVVGAFDSGYYEYDSRLSFIDFKSAKEFMNRGDIARWVEVKTPDMFKTEEFMKEIKSYLEPFTIADFLEGALKWNGMLTQLLDKGKNSQLNMENKSSIVDFISTAVSMINALKYQDLNLGSKNQYKIIDWREMNKNLFSALRLQKVVLSLFFMIIVVVASFNIVGTQTMVIHERIREISILLAMGATRGSIMRIFIIHGLFIGLMGVILGLGIGSLIVFGINWVHFRLDPHVYLISELPANFNPLMLIIIGTLAIFFTLITSTLSSIKKSQRTPIEGLRM